MKRLAAILFLALWPLCAATKVLVTVVEQKSGRPVADLKAGDFTLLEDKSARRIESAEFSTDPIDGRCEAGGRRSSTYRRNRRPAARRIREIVEGPLSPR